MMRLILVLVLVFFAVTFLLSILRRILKAGGITGMPGGQPAKHTSGEEDKSKIIDAKYEEIK